ncbi:MAG TPA: hypothetical protein VGI22_01040 [Xanthobacteraceae bacterium]|jgi:hypothetical protein
MRPINAVAAAAAFASVLSACGDPYYPGYAYSNSDAYSSGYRSYPSSYNYNPNSYSYYQTRPAYYGPRYGYYPSAPGYYAPGYAYRASRHYYGDYDGVRPGPQVTIAASLP